MSEDKYDLPNLGVSEVSAAHNHEALAPGEPLYPILSIDELPLGKETPDLRDELPRSVADYLGPKRKVVKIRHYDSESLGEHFTPLKVIIKAAEAKRAKEIGYQGPTNSSTSLVEGKKSRYEIKHGRDSEQAALDLYKLHPQLAETAAIFLAENQGVENEVYISGRPFGQESVGSIILVKFDPADAVAQKFERRLHWKPTFYGSVDAPLTFINMLYLLQKDRNFLIKTHYKSRQDGRPDELMTKAFDRSLEWLVNNADEHDGLIAYKNPVKGGGIRNQGWRDSDGAMVHKDGTWASDELGIAPIEVQGFAFDAYRNSARILRDVHKDSAKAAEMDDRASELQRRVIREGFVSTPEGGYFASGFDWGSHGQLRPLEVATSAAGRLFTSDILKADNPDVGEMTRHTIRKLFSPEMLTRWGIRTLASDEEAYVPFFYHTGPVWLHDTNEVAKGMSHHGYYGLDRIIGALTTNQRRATGVFYEHISGQDSDKPEVPNRDTYVYDEDHGSLYLFEQAPPPGQTWGATSEFAKRYRYRNNPLCAQDNQKFEFEKQIWRQLPDHIVGVVSLYEPQLAFELSK